MLLGTTCMTTIPISVVMCVFNGECFLREAVESILDQSFRDFEFIIINDGSTDGSGALLEFYQKKDQRVRVYHQDNQGLVRSLNRGCELARGKYIARMDADDIAVNDRLARQFQFMEEHPDIGVLGGAAEVIDSSGKTLKISVNPADDSQIRTALLTDCPFWHPTILMRKSLFERVGGYREIVFGSEDYDLWLRMADHGDLANLEAVLLRYRLHHHQVTVRKLREVTFSTLAARAAAEARKNGRPDPLNFVSEITPEVLVENGVSESAQESALALRYLWSIGILYDNGEYSDACTLFSEMSRLCKWQQAEKRIVADLRILAARLHWIQKDFLRSIFTACRAVFTRPIILARPLKPWLGAIGFMGNGLKTKAVFN
jgi:glycosyltransferase involved in cell wall biosynthesis